MQRGGLLCCFMVIACQLGSALCSRRPTGTRNCHDAREHFHKYPEIASAFSHHETYDENLVLCAFENHTTELRQSCCTEKTEQAFLEQALKDYNDSIHQETNVMRTLFTATASSFRENFISMVETAERRTHQAFQGTYGPATRTSHRAVTSFFVDVRDVLQRGGSGPTTSETALPDLAESANVMLDHVFAMAFYSQHVSAGTASGGGGEFTEEFASCVRSSRRVTFPLALGVDADGFAARLARATSAAAYLSRALELASEMLDTVAKHAPLTADCTHDLVKMSYCSSCYGQVTEQPCSDFCADVLGVCMGEVRKLERFWEFLLAALKILSEFTLRHGNVQALLSAVGEELVEGTTRNLLSIYGGDNSVLLYDQIVSVCGKPLVRVSQPLANGSQLGAAFMRNRSTTAFTNQDLSVEVKKLLVALDSEFRGFFGRLPPTICMTEKYYDTSAGHSCWDGLMQKSTGNKPKRLEFLQELAPKPAPLETLETLKKKLIALRKEVVEKFLRREPEVTQDTEDDGPDGSGTGSGASAPEDSYQTPQPHPPAIHRQQHIIGEVQSMWICVNCGFMAKPSRPVSSETQQNPAATDAPTSVVTVPAKSLLLPVTQKAKDEENKQQQQNAFGIAKGGGQKVALQQGVLLTTLVTLALL